MSSSRIDVIADAALGLLAERGMRGLTHRAVDEAAGLPEGSTSNHARTRSALLELALKRLAERQAQVLGSGEMPPMGTGAEGLAAMLAQALHRSLVDQGDLTRARFELALEATRRPELRQAYDAAGRAFREPLMMMLAAAGAADPERQSLSLVAWCEGVLFYSIAGADAATPPAEGQLRASATEVLHGMLGSQQRACP
jgi:DNA-binding transcriptional regulator YbjK